MTVGELIDILSKYDPNVEVDMTSCCYDYVDIDSVIADASSVTIVEKNH